MGGVGKPYQNGEPVTTALTDQVKLAGWATPSVFLAAGDPEKVKKRREACAEKHGNNGFGLNLEQQAQAVTGWNTPRATDGTHGGPNQGGGRSRQTPHGLANPTSKRRRKARRNSDG